MRTPGRREARQANTDRLSVTDISSPTFYVPEELDATTTYEYLLTAHAEGVRDNTAEISVTVLNRGALDVAMHASGSLVYEGSPDIAFDCSRRRVLRRGQPRVHVYAWTARGEYNRIRRY